jgi:hypothetical protein
VTTFVPSFMKICPQVQKLKGGKHGVVMSEAFRTESVLEGTMSIPEEYYFLGCNAV